MAVDGNFGRENIGPSDKFPWTTQKVDRPEDFLSVEEGKQNLGCVEVGSGQEGVIAFSALKSPHGRQSPEDLRTKWRGDYHVASAGILFCQCIPPYKVEEGESDKEGAFSFFDTDLKACCRHFERPHDLSISIVVSEIRKGESLS
ncbi:hypothetical protein ACTXT7_005928 [Hymenolepis weldensis]